MIHHPCPVVTSFFSGPTGFLRLIPVWSKTCLRVQPCNFSVPVIFLDSSLPARDILLNPTTGVGRV